MRVAIFGLGYVGTVTAAGLASQGHDVVGVDVERSKVAAINRGQSPVVEPGIDRLVRAGRLGGAGLRATTEVRDAMEGAEVSLVCVGTPSITSAATPTSATSPGPWRPARGDGRRRATAVGAATRSSSARPCHPAPGTPVVSPRSTPELLLRRVDRRTPPCVPRVPPQEGFRGRGPSSRRRSWCSEPRTRAQGAFEALFDFLDKEVGTSTSPPPRH
jgi:hypothetical protein